MPPPGLVFLKSCLHIQPVKCPQAAFLNIEMLRQLIEGTLMLSYFATDLLVPEGPGPWAAIR